MKVFISWSGTRSKELANLLRGWLPMVLQYAEPWVSDKDISAGERWAQAIAGELESSNFGIICVTPENLNSEWILFEAGALSKSMLDGKVIPLLFGLELSDLSGPLSQFQAQKVEENGISEIVKAINKVADNKASDQIVSQLIPSLWPRLQKSLESISDTQPSEKHMRPQHEILEELVSGVRGISTRLRDIDPEISERNNFKRMHKRLHPTMLQGLTHEFLDSEDSLAMLLVLSGLLREEFPWLSEILTEAYRELRACGVEDFGRVASRNYKTLNKMIRGPFLYELSGRSKSAYILMEELPTLIERLFSRIESMRSIEIDID